MSARFDDGKEEGALRTIGEVSDALGIKPHVLRYWEQQFPMLKPLKRSGGRRYYRPDDIAMVETIDRMVNERGYTLKGAKAAIRKGEGREEGVQTAASEPKMITPDVHAPAGEEAGAPQRDPQEEGPAPADVLPQLKALRARLAATLEA